MKCRCLGFDRSFPKFGLTRRSLESEVSTGRLRLLVQDSERPGDPVEDPLPFSVGSFPFPSFPLLSLWCHWLVGPNGPWTRKRPHVPKVTILVLVASVWPWSTSGVLPVSVRKS